MTRCPSCGKRFGVRQVEKKLVDEENETESSTMTVLVPGGYGRGASKPLNVQMTVHNERKSYLITYECSKCGHRWENSTTTVRKS